MPGGTPVARIGYAVAALYGVVSWSAGSPSTWPILVGCSAVISLIVGYVWLGSRPTVREILFFALVFRLLLFPVLPGLSDDSYRYVWDGILQWEGINPYSFVPAADALAHLHESQLFGFLNSDQYYSVYPPVSQLIFLAGGWVGPEHWIWAFLIIKACVIAAEMGGVYLLSKLVRPEALVLYAWNPISVIEVAGQGHTEGLLVGLLLAAIWSYRTGRARWSMVALTGAVWVKLYPIVLIPFLLRRVGWRYVWIPVVGSIGLLGAYWTPDLIANVRASLSLYVGYFEFNAAPYLLLKWIGYFKLGLTGFEASLGSGLAISYLAFVIWIFVADHFKTWSLSTVIFLLLGGYLVASTTVHPWYLLGILSMAPLLRTVPWAWLWLAAVTPATYLLYSHDFYWPVVWLGWGGWLVLLTADGLIVRISRSCLDTVMRARGRKKAEYVVPFIPLQQGNNLPTVLDIGAGEGYVGDALQQLIGCRVTLCDIRDSNRTNLPFVRYDGVELPFDEDWFDATYLIFTLHHCEDPLHIIEEAQRVTRGPIIILESVYDSTWDLKLLSILDRVANRVRSSHEMTEQEQWLNFSKTEEWVAAIERKGLQVQSVRRWGKIHKQALIVSEPPSSHS